MTHEGVVTTGFGAGQHEVHLTTLTGVGHAQTGTFFTIVAFGMQASCGHSAIVFTAPSLKSHFANIATLKTNKLKINLFIIPPQKLR